MNKQDLAMYLVNLHTLMQAQTSNVSLASTTLADEYARCWDQLKEVIKNEARQSDKQHDGLNKEGADLKGNLPRPG